MTLNTQMETLFAGIKANAPPPVIAKAVAIFDRLEAARLGQTAPKPGDRAPDVNLSSLDGATTTLADLVAAGPVTLMFYRGRWCPFCSLALTAYDKLADAFAAGGAPLVAVSPQTVAETRTMAANRPFAIRLMSDPQNAAAEAFAIAWSLTDDEKQLYAAFGSMLDAANGDDRWQLPAPAVFIIDRERTVRWSHVDPNHTRRIEPDAVLAALQELRLAA